MEFPRGASWFKCFKPSEILMLVAHRVKYYLSCRLSIAIKGLPKYQSYDEEIYKLFSSRLNWSRQNCEDEAAEIDEVMNELMITLNTQLEAGIEASNNSPFIVWNVSIQDMCLVLNNCGDWRINEWEEQNLDEKGRYVGSSKYEYEEESPCLTVGL